MPLIALAIGAGVGILKSELVDRPREQRQRKTRAAEIRYSPWTGLTPSQQIQEADPLGSAMQFGSTGAMLGQSIETRDFNKNFNEKLLSNMDKQYSTPTSVQVVTAPQQSPMMAAPPRYSVMPELYQQRNPWSLGGYSY